MQEKTAMSADLDAGLAQAMQARIRIVPDFPRPGIAFQELSPVFADPGLTRRLSQAVCAAFADAFDVVLAIEARGFVVGSGVAAIGYRPLIMARKQGKLPGPVRSAAYELEYGTAVLELQADAVGPGQRVLLVDDVLATGGTLAAAASLVSQSDGVIAGHAVAVRIDGLGGPQRLSPVRVYAALSVD